ncbi:MAG: CoA transferase, partial [Alphaproteobacteria bacterium]|nr:CoA transferase [Alphaproteobacteria bacterium]
MTDVTPNNAQGPLADLRVIEMGTLIAGPFCGQILGDFGAEVIKIEDPRAGDPMRQWGRSLPKGLSPWWPVIGRNKKSVGLDLRTPEGQALARTLIRGADVVIENFRPGAMEKWGLSYESLAAENPRLIMARVSGFGQTGPYSQRAGYGLIGEAMGGLRYVTGEPDRPPARAGISIGDSLAAMHAAMGILMALHHRERTGLGQVIDAALFESVLAVMENLVTEYDLTGYIRERSGSILPGIAP